MNRLLIAALLVGSTFAIDVQAQPNTPERIIWNIVRSRRPLSITRSNTRCSNAGSRDASARTSAAGSRM